VPIVLETTAGSGTSLGGRLEELAAIIEASRHQDRLGICLDTAHVFAAGWDVRTARGLDKLLERVQNLLGLRRLALVHANDSKTPLGSGVDRHEHIGRGEIGLEGFAALVNHPALDGVPLILETPKQDDPADDARNLGILRSLLVR
jgi:deoxyribonuclease-4